MLLRTTVNWSGLQATALGLVQAAPFKCPEEVCRPVRQATGFFVEMQIETMSLRQGNSDKKGGDGDAIIAWHARSCCRLFHRMKNRGIVGAEREDEAPRSLVSEDLAIGIGRHSGGVGSACWVCDREDVVLVVLLPGLWSRRS